MEKEAARKLAKEKEATGEDVSDFTDSDLVTDDKPATATPEDADDDETVSDFT